MELSEFQNRVLDDLKKIMQQSSNSKFEFCDNFSLEVNRDLEEFIVTDELLEEYGSALPTEKVINLKQINNIEEKRRSMKIKVVIKGMGDFYWLVNEKRSCTPWKVNIGQIKENYRVEYGLVYEKNGEKWILVSVMDWFGLFLGKARNWKGYSELMASYYLKHPAEFRMKAGEVKIKKIKLFRTNIWHLIFIAIAFYVVVFILFYLYNN